MKSRITQSAYQKAHYFLGNDFASTIVKNAEIYERGLAGLARAVVNEPRRRIRAHRHRLLTSYSSKITCLVRVMDEDCNFTPEAILEAASILDPRKDCGEAIRCWAKEKSSGNGWRPICSFGPKRAALQLLVSDVLEAQFGIDERNYLSRKKGAERASDWVVQKADEEDFSYFLLADIKDFFMSVRKEKVGEVTGLPKRVVDHTVLIGNDTHLAIGGLPPHLDFQTFVGAVRQGIPQGSRTSQTVSSLLLAPVLKQIASAERAIFHGDDCAFAASSLKEAKAFEKALDGMLASHPAGPFRLKRCSPENVKFGIDFLQYRHRRNIFTGKTVRRPAARSYRKYKERIEKYFTDMPYRDAFRAAARYRWRWIKAFRRWRVFPGSKLALWQLTMRAIEDGTDARSRLALAKILAWKL